MVVMATADKPWRIVLLFLGVLSAVACLYMNGLHISVSDIEAVLRVGSEARERRSAAGSNAATTTPSHEDLSLYKHLHTDPHIDTSERSQAASGVSTLRRLIDIPRSKAAGLDMSVTPAGDDSGSVHNTLPMHTIARCIAAVALFSAILGVLVSVVGPPADDGRATHREPPYWAPGDELRRPFRDWVQDLVLWTIRTDLQPAQQCAAIIQRLGGAARELARTLTPAEVFAGGDINGQQVDPVTYLLHGLTVRFAPLDDEGRLRAANELLTFSRRQGENVDDLVSRFEVVRARAQMDGGGASMSSESSSLLLLRACGVSHDQFQQLTGFLHHRLPHNEQELVQLMVHLRRLGHIIERFPGNIASTLRGGAAPSPSDQQAAFPAWSGSPHHEDAQSPEWSSPTSWSNQPSWTAPAPSASAYPTTEDNFSDTDSDTISDDGYYHDYTDIAGMNAAQADEYLFWKYEEAKSRWRQHTGKPVRAVRRVLRRKGMGKGKGKRAYPTDISAYFQNDDRFRGKGKGGKSTGKGFGRRENPRGRDGEIMKCSTCGSTTHLRARCPQGASGSAPPQPSAPALHGFTQDEGPLAGVLGAAAPEQHTTGLAFPVLVDLEPQPQLPARIAPDPMQANDPWAQLPKAAAMGRVSPPHRTAPIAPMRNVMPQRMPAPPPAAIAARALPVTLATRPSPEQAMPFWAAHPIHGLASAPAAMELMAGLGRAAAPAAAAPAAPPAALQPAEDAITAAGYASIFSNIQELRRMQTASLRPAAAAPATAVPAPTAAADGTNVPIPAGGAVDVEHATVPIHYDGDDSLCSICMCHFMEGERVCRLRCRHMFHSACVERAVYAHLETLAARLGEEATPPCPNCRGPGAVVASWPFIPAAGGTTPALSEANETQYETPDATSLADGDESTRADRPPWLAQADLSFVWWRDEAAPSSLGSDTSQSYHAGTGLDGERFGLLVDPGSWGNLQGSEWLVRAAKCAVHHNLKPEQKKRDKPLVVGGVGHGTQRCTWECTLPAALRRADGTYTEATYSAPTIEGSSCPALLGLQSLMSHKAILDCGTRTLHLCGDGEAQLTLPPGSESYPLTQVPSGHLLLPISDYAAAARSQDERGPPTVTRHLLATDSADEPMPVASVEAAQDPSPQ
jgi:hypothetical protein